MKLSCKGCHLGEMLRSARKCLPGHSTICGVSGGGQQLSPLPGWKQRKKRLFGVVGRAEERMWSTVSEVAAGIRCYWDQPGTATNPSLVVGPIEHRSISELGTASGSREGRGRAKQEFLKTCTCWRKCCGKDLGDIPLKSGRLCRGEPTYPLCTGEPRKSRAMLVAVGGLSRTCRMALSCGRRRR